MYRINNILIRLKSVDKKSKQLIKNVTLSFTIKGAAILVSFFTMPAYMNYFADQATLGMWFTAISMLSWILTFDLGIGNGLRNHLVKPLIENDEKEIRLNISSAYISVGIVVVILSLISFYFIPVLNWNSIFNISTNIVDRKTLTFMVKTLIIGVMIQFWLKLVTSILYALQKSALISILTLSSSLLMLLFTLLYKNSDPILNIKRISFAYVLTANIPYLIATMFLFSTRLKDCRPSLNFVQKKYVTAIIKLGGIFFYLQILTMIMFSTNEFLISLLIDPEQVVDFQVYNKLFSIISTLFNLALSPVWSAVTEACVIKDYLWVKRLYDKLNRILIFLLPLQLIVVIFMPEISKYWLGENAVTMNFMYGVVFAIYNTLFMKMSIDTSIIAGLGNLKIQSISLTITTVLKVIFSFVLIYFSKTWISIIIANILALIPYIIIEYFDINHKLNSFKVSDNYDF